MKRTRLTRRLAALATLLGLIVTVGMSAVWACTAYAAGEREIDDKRAQLRDLRDLAEARAAFARLSPKGKPQGLIAAVDADADNVLSSAVTHAAEDQQVIVDGVEPLTAGPVMRTAVVHLRGTQAGIYGFLRTVEQQTPYLLVPRLELTPSRAADPDHGKPLVLGADLRLALLMAPPVKLRKTAVPAEASP